MRGLRPQFVDAFLTSCQVEIFSPGEEICERGSISSDLFLLVGGIAVVSGDSKHTTDAAGSRRHSSDLQLEAGEFIGAIGFFTESPQITSVISLTVCKTLTISLSSYKLLAQNHPSSAGKILQNLLSAVETSSMQRVGSQYDLSDRHLSLSSINADDEAESMFRQDKSLTELVKNHMQKNLDDQTTRFNFAASRWVMNYHILPSLTTYF